MGQALTKVVSRRKEGDVFVYARTTPEGTTQYLVGPDPVVARPSKKGYVTVRDLTGMKITVQFPPQTDLQPTNASEVDIDLSSVADGRHEYIVYVDPNGTRQRAVGNSDPSIIVD